MSEKPVLPPKSDLVADWERLFRVFIRPEGRASRATLIKYMDRILYGLNDFLKKHVGITEEISLKDLSGEFTDTIISDNPEKKLADVIPEIEAKLLRVDLAPLHVVTHSPLWILKR